MNFLNLSSKTLLDHLCNIATDPVALLRTAAWGRSGKKLQNEASQHHNKRTIVSSMSLRRGRLHLWDWECVPVHGWPKFWSDATWSFECPTGQRKEQLTMLPRHSARRPQKTQVQRTLAVNFIARAK